MLNSITQEADIPVDLIYLSFDSSIKSPSLNDPASYNETINATIRVSRSTDVVPFTQSLCINIIMVMVINEMIQNK